MHVKGRDQTMAEFKPTAIKLNLSQKEKSQS